MNSLKLSLAITFIAVALLGTAPEVRSVERCLPTLVDGYFLCADCKPPDNAFCGVRGKKGCDNTGAQCDGGCIKGTKKCTKTKGKHRSGGFDQGMLDAKEMARMAAKLF